MPAHQVIVTASLEQQLDGTFAADLQQVAVVDAVVGLQEGIGRGGPVAPDPGALAQRFDGLVPYVVAEFVQLDFASA